MIHYTCKNNPKCYRCVACLHERIEALEAEVTRLKDENEWRAMEARNFQKQLQEYPLDEVY